MEYCLGNLPTAAPGDPCDFTAFPLTSEEFEADSRVSWSRISGKWLLELDDGSEFEFDEVLKRWIPVVCVSIPVA